MRKSFGTAPGGVEVERYVLTAASGLQVAVITYGAAIQTVRFEGSSLALGFPTLHGYVEHGAFGKTVGRFANRIAGARFSLDGREHVLDANERPNTLHGGSLGFGRRVWDVEHAALTEIRLRYTSPDGEMGFPGTLVAQVAYTLSDDRLRITRRRTRRSSRPERSRRSRAPRSTSPRSVPSARCSRRGASITTSSCAGGKAPCAARPASSIRSAAARWRCSPGSPACRSTS
jgi:hypothetical protein